MSENEKAFRMHRAYVKDLSFECPSAAEIRGSDVGVDIEFSVRAEHRRREPDGLWDVSIGVTLRYFDKGTGDTHYLIEATQGGLFEISGVSEEETDRLLRTECREAVYPFLRALLWSIGGHSGWKGMLLKPMEFDDLYQAAVESGKTESVTHDS